MSTFLYISTMKKYIYFLALIAFIGCKKESTATKKESDSIKMDAPVLVEQDSINTNTNKSDILKTRNDEVLASLKNKDFQKFASYIHPTKGVRFSMYAYVDLKGDKHFSKEDFIKYSPTNIKFTWGQQDGTGDLLVQSIRNYLTEWVHAESYTNAEFHLNNFKGTGNSLNNLQEKYPGLDFTENYKAGSGESADFNWSSLRFVFEELYGTYYLVAVINDTWTI